MEQRVPAVVALHSWSVSLGDEESLSHPSFSRNGIDSPGRTQLLPKCSDLPAVLP